MEAPERHSRHHQRRLKVTQEPAPFSFRGSVFRTATADIPKRTFSQTASTNSSSEDDDSTPLDDLPLSPATMSDSPSPPMTPPMILDSPVAVHRVGEDGSDSDGRRIRRVVEFSRPFFTAATHINDNATVIDLTSDTSEGEEVSAPNTTRSRRHTISGRQAQRLPRFAREIIDLDDDSYEPATAQRAAFINRSPSPDIQILGTRQLPTRTHARQPTPTLRRQDAQEVTFLETRRLPPPPPGIQVQPQPPPAARRRLPTPHIMAGRRHQHHGHFARVERHWERLHYGVIAAGARSMQDIIRDTIGLDMGMGIDLDYERLGFDLGAGEALPRVEQLPRPEYVPPPKVPDGFTRSPEEDECLVCPRCGDELSEGDGQLKKQIWVVKKCGHVYCGECSSYRTAAGRRRGKDIVTANAAFTRCVVAGCGKPVGGKNAMFQVYL